MEDGQKLLVGFDLCNDFSQMACYNYRTFEPESIGETLSEEQYLIPTALGVTTTKKKWIYGAEAIELANRKEAVLVSNIIETIERREKISIYDVTFTGGELLERFLRKCFTLLRKAYPDESIQRIVFTVKEPDSPLRDALREALDKLGIEEERYEIQSHKKSYLRYAFNQKRELWADDIGLFDFNESGFKYVQITINRNARSVIAGTREKDFSEYLNMHILRDPDSDEKKRYLLEDIIKSALHNQIISTVYFTGTGFDGDWADDLIASLCTGRRVFKGQNLYVKGACYEAREHTRKSKSEEILFLTDEVLESDILINVYSEARMSEVYLARAGEPWYNLSHRLDVILDDEEEIEITVRNVLTGKETKQIIALEGIISNCEKRTRVQIRTKCEDNKTCVITVKDLGFGEFFRTSNRIWEEKFHL